MIWTLLTLCLPAWVIRLEAVIDVLAREITRRTEPRFYIRLNSFAIFLFVVAVSPCQPLHIPKLPGHWSTCFFRNHCRSAAVQTFNQTCINTRKKTWESVQGERTRKWWRHLGPCHKDVQWLQRVWHSCSPSCTTALVLHCECLRLDHVLYLMDGEAWPLCSAWCTVSPSVKRHHTQPWEINRSFANVLLARPDRSAPARRRIYSRQQSYGDTPKDK